MADEWWNIEAFITGQGIPHGRATVAQTTGGTHAPGSLHYAGRARDYGNIDTPGGNSGCDRIYWALEPYAHGGGYIVQELFWNPIGCWQRGNRVGPVSGHWDHVHAGLGLGKRLPVIDRPPEEPPKPTVYQEEEAVLL